MAIFGAPIVHPNDAERAVKAALKMQEKNREFNRNRKNRGLKELEIGIDINSGMAVAGNIGSDRRMEYSVIGDTVNTASRVQALAEAGQVVITQTTYDYVKDMVKAVKKGPVEIKGEKEPLNLYIVESVI